MVVHRQAEAPGVVRACSLSTLAAAPFGRDEEGSILFMAPPRANRPIQGA